MDWRNNLTKEVLAEVPGTRNNDRLLIEEVWKRCGLHLTPEQHHIFHHKNTPSPETIRRTRQAIQERGLYTAVPDVQQARMDLEDKFRKGVKDGFSPDAKS